MVKLKPWLVVVFVFVFIFLMIGVWGYQIYRKSVRVCESIFSTHISTTAAVQDLQQWWQPATYIIPHLPVLTHTPLVDVIYSLQAVNDTIIHLPILLGLTTPRHYVVLFQNNMELRPTGGFLGSYAEMWMKEGKIADITIQDIYVPDGQIKGYVKEPEPIKKYLFNEEHPGWRLRDSNWSPDFPEAVKAINWFFKEGGLKSIDGMVAINLVPITDILTVTGNITLADYGGLVISTDSFYQEAQRHAEENFFPGSTQKGNFLSNVGKQLLYTLTSRTELIPQLLPALITNLREKHILMFIPDVLGDGWQQLGWDGRLRDYSSDYLMIVEANVGMSKANCCIDRTLTDDIQINSDTVKHHITIRYNNRNPVTPQPPIAWGGGYKNYMRLIVPKTASVAAVFVNNIPITSTDIDEELIGNKKSIGFLVLTEGGQQGTVQLMYSLPLQKSPTYSLLFQKQSGIEGWPAKITITQNGVSRIYKEDSLQHDKYFY